MGEAAYSKNTEIKPEAKKVDTGPHSPDALHAGLMMGYFDLNRWSTFNTPFALHLDYL